MSQCPASTVLDIDHLREWIGREERSIDEVGENLLRRFRATFDLAQETKSGQVAPRLVHFCLAQPIVRTCALGIDGHPEKGGFLPPVPFPRRMWAGSKIGFQGDLRGGDVIERVSRILDVNLKEGRRGALCFVQIGHEIRANDVPVISEIQDILYRPDPAVPAEQGDFRGPPQSPTTGRSTEWSRSVDASPQLLFRYSALTFNTHRIHYDLDYATSAEGYPGLVVHGPLQATLLLQLAEQVTGTPPVRFMFRSTAPLLAGRDFRLCAAERADGLELHAKSLDGQITMKANATW